MNDSSSVKTWKKIAVRAVFGGIGFAIGAAAIVGAVVWYSDRPTPPPQWDARALTAKYDTTEFTVGASDETISYPVDFYFNILIPPGGTARIDIKVSYRFPDEFTEADKKSADKIIGNLNRRTNELNGFVIFDEQNHYRIDLPRGWDFTKDNSTGPHAKKSVPPCPSDDPAGLFTKSPCTPLPGSKK